MTSRAHLLAGLRTGGPRSTSPFEGANNDADATSGNAARGLKANAAPFMPSAMPDQQQYDAAQEIQSRMAALQMQHSMLVNDASSTGMQGRGQPRRPTSQQQQALTQQHFLQKQQQVEQLIRQKQAQLLENQLLQQYQEQQAQLDLLRQGQVNDLQAQMLFQQMQTGNQQQRQMQQQSRHLRSASLTDQRQMPGGMRQRQQTSHMNHNQPMVYDNELSQQHQLLLQRINGIRQVSQPYPVESNAIPMRSVPNRSGSPGMAAQTGRARQPSTTAADTAKSWRSSSVALPKTRGTPPPPSIVVDDSASEKSDEQSSHDTSALETPETSEEDVGLSLRRLSGDKDDATVTVPMIAPLPMRKRVPSTQQQPQSGSSTFSAGRVASVGATPRPRHFASAEGQRAASAGSSSAGSITPSIGGSSAPQPARQPRGPPTEFQSVNFAARLSMRTRREAMVKLSASPRIASFAQPPASTSSGAARRPSLSVPEQ